MRRRVIRRAGEKFVAVRFGNVMGSRGSLLEIWERQFKANEPLTITDPKMERYFMTIKEACGLVIEAATKGKGGELYILDMGEPISIMQLKEELYGDYPIKVIGIRPGEALSEKLMTDDEQKRAVKKGKFWVI
jgi:FlaA1/EpsC-like NDP-sugar epimerase